MGPSFGLHEQFPDIFTDDSQYDQLDAADKQDADQDGGPSGGCLAGKDFHQDGINTINKG